MNNLLTQNDVLTVMECELLIKMTDPVEFKDRDFFTSHVDDNLYNLIRGILLNHNINNRSFLNRTSVPEVGKAFAPISTKYETTFDFDSAEDRLKQLLVEVGSINRRISLYRDLNANPKQLENNLFMDDAIQNELDDLEKRIVVSQEAYQEIVLAKHLFYAQLPFTKEPHGEISMRPFFGTLHLLQSSTGATFKVTRPKGVWNTVTYLPFNKFIL